jgi:hypothetical protein
MSPVYTLPSVPPAPAGAIGIFFSRATRRTRRLDAGHAPHTFRRRRLASGASGPGCGLPRRRTLPGRTRLGPLARFSASGITTPSASPRVATGHRHDGNGASGRDTAATILIN